MSGGTSSSLDENRFMSLVRAHLDDPIARALHDAAPEFILVTDASLRIQFVNRYQRGVRPEDVIGKPVDVLTDPAHVEALYESVARARRTGVPSSHETAGVGEDGEEAWYQSRIAPVIDHGLVVGFVIASYDVTERRRIDERLRLAQKMEAIGQLTAGVAHNFNNMLMAILPTLDLASRVVEGSLASHVREAQHAGQRAAELVRDLMAFAGARRSTARLAEPIDAIVERAVSLCRRLVDRRVALDLEVRGPLPLVALDAGPIEQALVNILLNARDAVGEVSSPHIGVVVEATSTGVRIDVTDDGAGMTDEVRARIFEPFFTTKEVGQGTGLGLATTYAIIEDHGGQIECTSEPGRGTTFTIRLPAARDVTPRPPPPRPSQAHARSGGHVLVVEDEAPLRRLVHQVLASAGYTVTDASSSDAALAALPGEPEVELLLLDRSLAEGRSAALVAALRERAPRARIVFFTGAEVGAGDAALVDGVLHKPASVEEVLEAVRAALALGPRS